MKDMASQREDEEVVAELAETFFHDIGRSEERGMDWCLAVAARFVRVFGLDAARRHCRENEPFDVSEFL